ncbi:hypothetical protein AHAS_Ahas09G0199800 [Arachis hypogaea]
MWDVGSVVNLLGVCGLARLAHDGVEADGVTDLTPTVTGGSEKSFPAVDLLPGWRANRLRHAQQKRTTSRCEGINAFVKGFLKSTNSLLVLVHSLDRVVKDYRNNEVTAQFYSTYYTPVLNTGLDNIEGFASKIYTRTVFKEVRKQIKGVGSLLFLGKDSISTTSVCSFSNMVNRRRVHRVLYDPSEPKIECDCHMWNSEGIPCFHIFCLMKYEGLAEIPPGLILRRWCKDAKEWTPSETEGIDGHGTRLLRHLHLGCRHRMILYAPPIALNGHVSLLASYKESGYESQ